MLGILATSARAVPLAKVADRHSHKSDQLLAIVMIAVLALIVAVVREIRAARPEDDAPAVSMPVAGVG